jgi:ribosomal protein S12 methylthiotransferase accessory factor YcaO
MSIIPEDNTKIRVMSDKERATTLRVELEDVMRPVLALIDKARKDGIEVQFQLASGATGKQIISMINIFRIL